MADGETTAGIGALGGHEARRRERRSWSDRLRARRAEVLQAWWSAQFDPSRLRRFGVPIETLPPGRALVRSFLIPTFELLRAWLGTGEQRYADVYLDERLRYAPHQASWEIRRAFFDEVLALDERALLSAFPEGSARAEVEAPLRALHAPLRAEAPERPVRILAMGDCLMHEVRVALLSRCRADGIPIDFRGLYFSALYGNGLSADEALALVRDAPPDLVALSFLSYKGIAPFAALMREAPRLPAREIDRRVETIVAVMREFLALLRARTDAPFLVHDASGLPLTPARHFLPLLAALSSQHRATLDALNERVRELVGATPKAILVEEAAIAARRGLRACMERVIPPGVASGGEFHTARFGEYLAPAYADVIASYRALGRCKALAVDLDDTLWDGVMADGPVVQRMDLQRTLRRLREAGILLVVTSKNDPKNVRWSEMLLRRDDFVLEKVSWNLKAQSIQEAAAELNIGVNGFALLDDRAEERELVRSHLPGVTTLDPHAPRTRAWLERMLSFPNTAQTDEARNRTELYRARRQRAAALEAPLDYPAMMASLGLRVTFGPAQPRELDRIAELVQRTNQFNTTTIRHERPRLKELLRDPAHGVYSATLADKFGSMGLVAVAIVRREADDRIVEAVVMSCRAMGFGLERLVVRRLIAAEDGPGVRFIGRYLPTDRNEPCRSLWESCGFVANGDETWVLEAGAPRLQEPPWFRTSGSGKQRAA